MIAEFLSSWPLFHNAYLSGWLISVLLALIGVLVVARDQIFLGATVPQASALGIAVGMMFGSWLTPNEDSWWRSHVSSMASWVGYFPSLPRSSLPTVTKPRDKIVTRRSQDGFFIFRSAPLFYCSLTVHTT
jgi:hypothetical protein